MTFQVVVVKRRAPIKPLTTQPSGRALPPRPPSMDQIADALDVIRVRVRNNKPQHHKPEAFHEEKSEIAGLISEVISAVRTGRPINLNGR